MKNIIALLIVMFALAGCNTMEGVGKDMKKLGESVENAARK